MDLVVIINIDDAVDGLMDFITVDAMAINEDRLKALKFMRIILETSNITLDGLRYENKIQREEIQALKRKLTKARVR